MENSRSLYETKFYHESAIEFARSIILKSHATAVAMNEEINRTYISKGLSEVNEFDPSTWRYYLHLQGIYHEWDRYHIKRKYTLTDPRYSAEGYLRVISLDTLKYIDFTRENLEEHRSTWLHYSEKGEYYQELIKEFPDMHVLIDGICNPLDYEKCYRAKEYEILYYNKKYVEDQEVYLIDELNRQIQFFTKRFHARGYMQTDPMYRALKIGILATHIPGMIVSIRENYANTEFAHSYHIWSYLSGWFKLDDFKPYLTFKQVMWLYRNIRYIDIKGGKVRNFERLMQKLLSDREIPLYEFTISADNSALLDEHIWLPDVQRNQLNLPGYTFSNDEKQTVNTLLDKEEKISYNDPTQRNKQFDNLNQRLSETVIHQRKTKLLESEIYDFSNQERFPLEEIALNMWVHLTYTDRYSISKHTRHPVTNELITLESKEGIVLWYYLMNKLINKKDDKKTIENRLIPSINIYDIPFDYPSISWSFLKYEFTNQKYKIHDVIDDLQLAYPPPRATFSTEKFHEYILQWRDFRMYGRLKQIIHQDLSYYGEVTNVIARLMFHQKVSLTSRPTTFGAYIKARHWNVDDLTTNQMTKLASDIFYQFTGVSTEDQNSVEKTLEALLVLFRRLSSYSIQFTGNVIKSGDQIMEIPYIRYGHLHGLERNVTESDFRWIPWWYQRRGSEYASHKISMYMDVDSFEAHGKELAKHDLSLMLEYDYTAKTLSKRHVPLNLPAFHLIEDDSEEEPNYDFYYVFNNTIYYWKDDERVGSSVGRRGTEPPEGSKTCGL